MVNNLIIGQLVLLIFYGAVILSGNHGPHEFLLSSGIVFMASILMVKAFKHFKRILVELKLMFVAMVVWAILDLYRFATTSGLMHTRLPSGLDENIYLVVNVLLLIICTRYFIMNIKEWHKYQLVLDTIFVMTLLVISLSGVYQQSNMSFDTSLFNLASIIFFIFPNGLIISLLTILIVSTRKRKMNRLLKVYVGGMIAYVVIDVIYAYLLLMNLPNTPLLDLLYALNFSIIAIGTVFLREENRGQRQPTLDNFDYNNIGRNKFLRGIVFVTLILILVKIIDLRTVLHIFAILMIYLFLTSYLKNLIITQRLLANERKLTTDLEERVSERTEMLVEANRQLKDQSEKDMLTGIYNRHYFFETLESLTEAQDPFTLLYLDLDRFKFINDVHGHTIGDQVIQVIASRFVGNCTEKCMISRIGGDEFAVIIRSKEPQIINQYAEAITALVEEEIIIDGYRFKLSISIGAARYPDDATAPETLLKYADTAMYYAKRSNTATTFLYDDESISRIERRHRIEWLLSQIDYNKEFRLHYQPQFKTGEKALLGMEALLRWYNPELGNIPPNEFIPIAEEAGQIDQITDWVIHEALSQVKAWNQAYGTDLMVGINISAMSLNSIDFENKIQEAMVAHGVKAGWVDLEMTEYNSINALENVPLLFEKLRHMGISISIDDFGTGYSSLSYIKKFQVNRIKIAKEMIDTIVDHEADKLIIKAIIDMAHGLNYRVIAEGVETQAQLEILKAIGCDEIQGYLWGRPVKNRDFEREYLHRH